MEENQKLLTEEELLEQFEDYYKNYMDNLVANLEIGAKISKEIFGKLKNQDCLEKYLEYFFELNRTAVSMRETLVETRERIFNNEKN